MPKRDHLDVFRKAVESEITSGNVQTDPILQHIREVAKLMRQVYHDKRGRWPTFEDPRAHGRDMSLFAKAVASYWETQGLEWVPLDVIQSRHQEFFHCFADAFYGFAERTPLPGEL